MVEMTKIRQAQIAESELLKKFREICDAEGMRYYLLGGTVLGAVRHKGFIPWDDDIDVGLMRNDYDSFIEKSKKYLESNQKILHYTIDPNYHDYSMKLVNQRVSYLTQRDNCVVKQNIWIDIFPIDGAPNSSLKRKIHYYRAYYTRMLLGLNHIDSIHRKDNRSRLRRMVIFIARIIPIGKLINPERVKKKLDIILRKYHVEQCLIVGNYIGAYHEREFLPKEYFDEGRREIFEGEEYIVPKETDKYLTHIYGDYMKLPGKEKQIPTHNIIDIIFEN